jgi:hypothetical protein
VKNFLRSAFSLGLLLTVGAQAGHAQALPVIPNAGFETWSPHTVQGLGGPLTYQAPTSWDAGFFSSLLAAFGGQPPRFERSTTAHSGAAAVRINVGADSVGADVITRFAVTSAPAGMTAWVRNSVAFTDPNDAGFVLLVFTRSLPGGTSDTVAVGGGSLLTATANTWQQIAMPIAPIQAAAPDSVTIYFANMGGQRANYQTYLDDVAFTNTRPTGTAENAADAAPLTISPNPVSSNAAAPVLTVPVRTAGRAALVLTDALGREAGRVRMHNLHVGENELPVPVQGLAAGTYMVRVISGEGTRTTRLVVQ